ncbi:hypothetical protein [Aquamicrobium zhengzhouense]|uniref:Uncharacterized protein n=1 Tax=Aquamicrobium zhengzhouense TaxID=2781738 RepID=A0ABS0SH25_9HYPH|nr:hypothetical protein [Aquamicrobium zhengzhouense]MBI1622604.1 hypothetical protein [Aquamicrobium zhengzhouense]
MKIGIKRTNDLEKFPPFAKLVNDQEGNAAADYRGQLSVRHHTRRAR